MPDDDGLTQEERERLAEFDDGGPEPDESKGAARDGDPAPLTALPGGKGGAPLADRPEPDEPDGDSKQEELFSVEEAGKVVTLAQLVRRNTPVEVKYKMTGRSLGAGRSGLIDPYATTMLILADCVVDDVDIQYVRDAEHRVEKIIQYVTLKPRTALPALSEAGEVMVAEAKKAKSAA